MDAKDSRFHATVGSVRGGTKLPFAALALVLLAVPLLALVEVPGERRVKEALGFEYEPVQRCGELRHTGRNAAPWRVEPALDGPRDEARAAVVGRSAYLVGGISDLDLTKGTASSVDTFERFDFEAGRYVDLPPLPERLNHVGVVAYRGDVYVVGGHNDFLGRAEATGSAWRYRVARRRWERIAPMPTPRGGHALVVAGDKMYAIGGRHRMLRMGTVESYDFRTGKWSSQTAMPTGRDHLGATAYKGDVYVAGGRQNKDYSLAAFERYDPEGDRWSKLPDMPEAISSIEMVTVGDRLVTAGGGDALKYWVTGRAWTYDPGRRAWSQLPSSPRPKHGYAGVAYNGRMYMFGGSRCGAFRATDSVESLRVAGAAS